MRREWVISEEDLGCDGSYLSYNEVVRCKDCKWWERDYQSRYHSDERPCNIVGMETPPEWYCADGERRREG